MSVTGTVENGVVKLPAGVQLPDGTEVEVTLLVATKEAEQFTDELVRIASQTKNLPADLARNHDHYLHGLPKK